MIIKFKVSHRKIELARSILDRGKKKKKRPVKRESSFIFLFFFLLSPGDKLFE